MIVALGGRPWTGKTTLAKALATAMSGVLLDKAALQRVLFPRRAPASPEQSDRVYEFLLQAAVWHLETTPKGVVVLDGRPLTRTREVLALRRFACGVDQPLRIIECICPDEVAVDRARANLASSTEPLTVVNEVPAEPIPDPKIVIDTSLPVDHCLASALEYLSRAPTSRRTRQTDSPVHARNGKRGTGEPLEQLAGNGSWEVA